MICFAVFYPIFIVNEFGFMAYGTAQHTVASTAEFKVIKSGMIIDTSYDSSCGGALNSITLELAIDERLDLIISSRPSLNCLTAPSFESTNNRLDVARSDIGIARKEVEIGFQQSNDVLPIPASLQKISTFSISILRLTSKLEYSKKFIAYLTSKDAAAMISTADLLPVVLKNPTPESTT